MTPEERLDRIEQLMARQAEQNTAFQESLNETKALQDRNAEAISQQLEMISQLRQIVVNNAVNASDLKSELARHANNPNAHGNSAS